MWGQIEKHTDFHASMEIRLRLGSGLKISCLDSLNGEKVLNCLSISQWSS